MLYVAYGLNHGMPEWQNIPRASEIGETFATDGGLSFAFMNLSKISSENGSWEADWEAINAIDARSRANANFTEQEIALIEPDIVITMNLPSHYASLGQVEHMLTHGEAESAWLTSSGHRSLLINTWHFSARKKSVECFYNPICEIVRSRLPRGSLRHTIGAQ
jgi:hypothetical protein